MKRLCLILLPLLVFMACKKINMPEVVDVNLDEVATTLTTAVIQGTYEYNMPADAIVLIYGKSKDLTSSENVEMNVNGNSFNVTLTELDPNTKYYFKIRFTAPLSSFETEIDDFYTVETGGGDNDDGGDNDGGDNGEDDNGGGDVVVLPSVVMKTIDNVTQTTAVFRAVVSADGGADVTRRGFCWSKTQNPTINNNTVNSGSGVGEFYNSITDLTPNTKYYVKAYAENSEGVAYSTQTSFTTLEEENPINTETVTVNGVSFVMVEVEGGTFAMGGSGVGSNLDESPIHDVTLDTYFIGETEVTQSLWKAVMGDNPSHNVGDDKPVDNISWDMAQEFVEMLSYLSGKTFRLPTEAEWEYAARGGNRTNNYKYSGSNSVNNVAWYDDNSSYVSHDVKTKIPNELGIYDMSGNVFEWCSDWYGSYNSSAQTNPVGPESGNNKVVRGGSFSYSDSYCRVADRFSGTPSWSDVCYGFRLVMEK